MLLERNHGTTRGVMTFKLLLLPATKEESLVTPAKLSITSSRMKLHPRGWNPAWPLRTLQIWRAETSVFNHKFTLLIPEEDMTLRTTYNKGRTTVESYFQHFLENDKYIGKCIESLGPCSSVGISTDYGLDGPGIECRSAAVRSGELEGHWMSPNRERSRPGNAARRVFTESRLFYGGIWKLKFLLAPSLTLTAIKMQFVRRLQMLRRTLSVTSWPVYLVDGSNALIVMKDI
jgi:hypothetical protein